MPALSFCVPVLKTAMLVPVARILTVIPGEATGHYPALGDFRMSD